MRASREAYPAKPCTAGTMEHLTDMDALALVTGINVACARAEYLRSLFPLPPGRIERATHGEDLAPCPFCGGSDIDPHYMTNAEIAPIHGDGAMPGCRSCGATAPSREGWNRRTYSTPMRQQRLEEDGMKADEAEARAGRAAAQRDRGLAIIERLLNLVDRLQREIQELDASFELRWDADMRAIDKWREGGGDPQMWPSHDDLVVWLVERCEQAEEEAREVNACAERAGPNILFESAASGLKYRSPAAAGTISAIIVNESRWEEFVQKTPAPIDEQRAAIANVLAWVEERVAPRRCDGSGVSGCWRCNTVFLASVLRRVMELEQGDAT